MKYLFCLTIALSFGLYQAFWTDCPGLGVIGPDSITSPNCTATRCTVTRGQILFADILATFAGSHNELRTTVVATWLGVNINLPVDYPYDNVCNVITFPDGTPTTCPTIPNAQRRLPIEMPIPTAYPAINNARVQVSFFDGTERVACGLLTAVDIA